MKEFVFLDYSASSELNAFCLDSPNIYLGALEDENLVIISEDRLEETRDTLLRNPQSGKGWWISREIKNGKLLYSHHHILDKLMDLKGEINKFVIYSEKDKAYLGLRNDILTWIDYSEETGLGGYEFYTPFDNPEEAVIHLLILGASFAGVLCDEDFETIGELLEGLRSGKYQICDYVYEDGTRSFRRAGETIEIPIPEGYQLDKEKSIDKVVFKKIKP